MRVPFTCCQCGAVKFGFFVYCRHLKQYHESESGFKVSCNFERCTSVYTKVNSFVKHAMRCHKALLSTHCTVSDCAVTPENADSNDDEPMSTECALSICANESPSPTEEKCMNVEQLFGNVESHCISFVLGLREKHMLSSVVQDEVVSGLKHMLSSTLTDYRDLILTHVQTAADSNIPLSEGLRSALNIERHCEAVGKHFESEYGLLRYLKQTDKIVMPQTLVLNSRNPKQTFQYVPVLQVLHKLLCRDDVVDHFATRHPRQDSLMEDFCDGFLFKGDSFFAENPSALIIHLYCDEFEVCNPIGPKKGKHKITAFYYTVGNFHPKWRSQTRWIFLAILIKHQYLVANGLCYEAVLQPLLTDLKYLQERGIEIVTNSNQKLTVKGKLVSVCADNLSAHTIAGFQQHFHAGRICRTCLADYADISEKFAPSDFRLRTADIHSYHLQAVSENSLNASVYGVKGPCSFSNNLPDFDVTRRFPHDIMHDLLEGVLPRTTRLVLAHFIQKSQVDQLNIVLTELNLAHGNKPNKLTAASLTSRITGTAVQQLEMFLLLPRLLVPFVTLETEDRVWCVYLYLREICDIVLAHTADVDNLSLLEDLVCRYLKLYVQVFGPENVIPKHHYMVHYAHHLQLFGPLRHMWCMRFEAKHRYFKTIATASQSFQNVTKTLAKRHQMRQPAVSYVLPQFIEEVQCNLTAEHADKFKIGCKLRSLLIDGIYNDLTANGILYPSQLVYNNVTSAITLKYPFLADYDGTANSWRFALRRKFKRCRQPLVQEGTVADMRTKYGRPGISGRKRKCPEDAGQVEETVAIHKVARFKTTVVDEVVLGEDDRSIQKHIAFMQKECKRKDPNLDIIRDSMKRTAAYRQKYCHEHRVQDVLDTFPSLRMKLFTVAEVKLLYDLDVTHVTDRLLQLYPALVKEAAGRKDTAATMDTFRRQYEDASTDMRTDLKLKLCLQLLSAFFHDQFHLLHVEREEEITQLTPCIFGVTEYSVKLDGVSLLKCKTVSFKKAFEVWFAAYFIFSICFPKKLANLCQFVEKVLLKRGGRPTSLVRKWANRLS